MPTLKNKTGAKPGDKANSKKPAKGADKTNPDVAPTKVIYPQLRVEIRVGAKAITEDYAKELMGWEVETDDVKFGTNYLFIDREGHKVRCRNVARNREFVLTWCEAICQTILKLQWRMNCETVIVSKTGQVLSGQHRLIALILACQTWRGKQKGHWEEFWQTAPTIESLVALGAEETHDVLSTLDNTKPRTFSDVLFTSDVFHEVPKAARKQMSRMADYAIRLLWDRTGAKDDPFAPRRTHQEAMHFLERHPKLKECLKHIYEEDSEGGISKLMSPGYATGLLYLMGSSDSNIDDYTNLDPEPGEKALDFGLWDKACDFWVQYVKASPKMMEVRYAIAGLADPETGNGGTQAEKFAVLAKAWHAYADGSKLTKEVLALRVRRDSDGVRQLMEHPLFGGIDQGSSTDRKLERAERKQQDAEIHEPVDGDAPSTEAPVADPTEEQGGYDDRRDFQEPDDVADELAAGESLARSERQKKDAKALKAKALAEAIRKRREAKKDAKPGK